MLLLIGKPARNQYGTRLARNNPFSVHARLQVIGFEGLCFVKRDVAFIMPLSLLALSVYISVVSSERLAPGELPM